MRKLLPVLAVLCLTVVPAAFAADSSTAKRSAKALEASAPQSTVGSLGPGAFRAVATAAHRNTRVHLRQTARKRGVAAAKAAGRKHREATAPRPSTPPQLQAIAACESGGDPHAVGGGGTYRGKYQFDEGTWESVGGSGDPAAAPEAEQDKRAAMLYARNGAGQWPVCGQ